MPQLEQPKKKLPPWSQAKVNVPDVSTMTLNGTPSQTVPVHNVPETGPTNPPISTSGSAHISVSSPDVISNSRIDNASTASGPNPTVTYSNASGTESPTPHLNNKTEASHTQTPSTVPTSMSVEAQAFVSNSTAPPTAEPRGLNRYTTNTQHNTRGDAREAQAEVKNDSTTPLKPPKGKRKACRYYKATGQCKAGDACAFQHNTTQQNSTRAGSERTSSGHGTAGIDSEGTNNRGGDSRGTGETSRSQRNAKRDAKRDAVNNHTQMEKDVEVADGPDIDSGNKPPKTANRECDAYRKNQKCRFGTKCRYSHVKRETTDAHGPVLESITAPEKRTVPTQRVVKPGQTVSLPPVALRATEIKQLRRLYGSGLHVETLDLPTDRAELAVSTQRALEVTSEGTPGAAPGQEQKGPADTNGDISAVKTDKVASNPTVSQPKTDVLVVDFVPTDPDWIFDAMRLFKVQIVLPPTYPESAFQAQVVNDNIDSTFLTIVNTSLREYVAKNYQAWHRRSDTCVRAFLKWLDTSIEALLVNGHRELKRLAALESSGLNFVHHTDLKPVGKEPEPSPEPPQQPVQGTAETVNEATAPGPQSTGPRGVALNLMGLQLDQIATTRLHVFVASMSCARCGQRFDVTLRVPDNGPVKPHGGSLAPATNSTPSESTADEANSATDQADDTAQPVITDRQLRTNLYASQCERCAYTHSALFHVGLVHPHSTLAGHLELVGCMAYDCVMNEWVWVVTCLECGDDLHKVKNVVRGCPTRLRCRQCHTAMVLTVEGVKVGRTVAGAKHASLLEGVTAKEKSSADKGKGAVPLVVGEPLPKMGTCKHYSKSNRWLRFACCGKVFPCDICHDIAVNGDHPMEWATRMVCGFCSREMSFSKKANCVCGNSVTVAHSHHWNGGKGMRDKKHMSSKDAAKYRNSKNKTQSKKNERVGKQPDK